MKFNTMRAFAAILLALGVTWAMAEEVSPMGRVIALLEDIKKEVKEEASAEDAQIKERKDLCERRASDLAYEIKTAKSDIEELSAKIEKAAGKIENLQSSIQELAGGIPSLEAELASARDVRQKEKEDYLAALKDLSDTQATIEKAMSALEQEENKGKASLLQVGSKSAQGALQAIQALMEASMIGQQDGKALTALLQSKQEDIDFQPPTVAPYEAKNGGVIDLLLDMLDKSRDEVDDLNKKETASRNSFQLVVQGLQDQIKFDKEELQRTKKTQLGLETDKAADTKDFQETQASLAEDEKALRDFSADCKKAYAEYDEESKSRRLELEALESAKATLQESMSSPSFLQLAQKSSLHRRVSAKHLKAIKLIHELGEKEGDHQLLLLSRRMSSIAHSESSSGKADVFEKIKKLIQDMIETMKKNLQEEASKKAYCDTETKKHNQKKDEKQDEIDEVDIKIDKTASKSALLKKQVKTLKEELIALAETQVNLTKLRQSQKALYDKDEPATDASLKAVRSAKKTLLGFYKKSGIKVTSGERTGAAGGIIGRLEDLEVDFARSLSEMRAAEKAAQAAFDKDMEDIKLEKIQKRKDEEYKTAEVNRLDADLGEVNTDRESLVTEMGAIVDFGKGLEAECAVTEESFAEKQLKKQAEIDGLKEALDSLGATSAADVSGDVSVPPPTFLQHRMLLRGHQQRVAS